MERLGSFRGLSSSQKTNIVFGWFFLVAATLNVATFGFPAVLTPAHADVWFFVVLGGLFLLLSRFDNTAISVAQFIGLALISLVVIRFNDDPSSLTGFVLLTIAVLVAYKRDLFGRGTLAVLSAVVVAALAAASWGGYVHGFALAQVLNLVNFVVAYFAILYVLFEEDILALREERNKLEEETAQLRPFAELGENINGLVHDLKGDVAGLESMAHLEKLEGNSELYKKLHNYAERIDRRIHSILYIATARDTDTPETVDLRELVDSAVYYFVGINRSLRHAVQFSVEGPEGIKVFARRATLLVIVENVVKNSIEATEGLARRRIDISLTETVDHAGLIIRNSGRPLPWCDGKPINVLESNVFRRGRSTKPQGSGVGMWRVKTALRQLGATMIMENTDNGVRSTIQIPFSPASGRSKSRNH